MSEALREDPRVVRSRNAVADATLDLLVELGYSGLTIDAVSKRSGVARSTIYRHYSSVAEMVMGAVQTEQDQNTPHPSGDPWVDIRNEMLAVVDKLTSTRWGHVLPEVLAAASRGGEFLRFQMIFANERRVEMQRLLEELRSTGRTDPDADIDLINDLLVAPIFYRVLVSHAAVSEDFVDVLMARVLV